MGMEFIKNLYLASPAAIQNAAISAYGIKKYQERYVGKIPSEYQNLGGPLTPAKAEHYEIQEKRLTKLLEYAKRYVPFYKNELKNTDITAISSKTLPDFLPIITKKDITNDPSMFISTNALDKLFTQRLFTSGSSGSPLEYLASNLSRRINYHYYENALNMFDCTYRSRSTTLAGRILYKPGSKKIARYDYFNRTQYLSSYNISGSTIKSYIDALNKWQPYFIDSYPSALVNIIKLAKNSSLSIAFSPRTILTSSETLSKTSRALIENFFECNVLDQYGCTEMSVNAFSSGSFYYADPRYSVNEIETTLGESGPLVCTGLLNYSMPLIRYSIGDIVTPVGGNPYIFESIDGRVDDVIVTPEGKKIGRIDPAFKGMQGIELAQVVQTGLRDITVKVLVSDHNLFQPDKLKNNLKERTSESMNIAILEVNHIPRETNGKFKSVINLYEKTKI